MRQIDQGPSYVLDLPPCVSEGRTGLQLLWASVLGRMSGSYISPVPIGYLPWLCFQESTCSLATATVTVQGGHGNPVVAIKPEERCIPTSSGNAVMRETLGCADFPLPCCIISGVRFETCSLGGSAGKQVISFPPPFMSIPSRMCAVPFARHAPRLEVYEVVVPVSMGRRFGACS